MRIEYPIISESFDAQIGHTNFKYFRFIVGMEIKNLGTATFSEQYEVISQIFVNFAC